VISEILFAVSRQSVHQMSLDLPQSKGTTTTKDNVIFKYLSQPISDLLGFEKNR